MTIRWLRADEVRPTSEPRLYLKGAAKYHVLRWKIGPREYVETYERDANGAIVRDVATTAKRIDFDEAFELYAAGKTLTQIAALLGHDHGALSRVFARQGVTMRSARDYRCPDLDPNEVERLYVVDRLGIVEVGRRVGVQPSTVRRILNERGVAPKRSGNTTKNPDGPSFERRFRVAREETRARSGGRCEARVLEVCVGVASHVHHRKLRSQGGGNDQSNLLDLCDRCHLWAHHHPKRAIELGIIVPSWVDPATVEVIAQQSAAA